MTTQPTASAVSPFMDSVFPALSADVAVLVFGLSMSAMLAYAVTVALRARRAARTAEEALARLHAEMQEYQKVQRIAEAAERFSHNIADTLDNVSTDITERKRMEDNLSLQSEITANAAEGICLVKAADGSILYVNRCFNEMFGYAGDELLGKNIAIINAPADKSPEETATAIIAALHAQGRWSGEVLNIRKDGTTFWTYATVSAYQHPEHGTVWVTHQADISQTKLAQQALQETAQRLSLAKSAANIGIWDLDLTNNRLLWDERMYEMYDVEPDQFEGAYQSWRQRVHPDDLPGVIAEEQAAVQGLRDFHTEFRIITPDGRLRFVEAFAVVLRAADATPLRLIGINMDISERKQGEEQRRLASKVFENSGEAILITDATGKILSANPAFSHVTGYSAEAVVGLSTRVLKSGRHDKNFYGELWRCLNDAGNWRGEIWNRRKNGEIFPVWQTISAVRDARGMISNYVALFTDISERKAAEAALLEAMRSAEAANVAKSRFLAAMSHEIRTPMNGIIGLVQLALEQPLSPKVRDYLEKVQSASDSLLSILNDVLDYAKIEAGYMTLESKAFNLDAMLENLRHLFYLRAEEKGLTFTIQVAEDVPRHLIGDELRLQQVLANLLGNALKFTERGSVCLSVTFQGMRHAQALLAFRVTDTGIGMSEAVIANLFQPFTQADAALSRHFGGTGLGLAISHRLLQLLGSHCEVASQPGQGAAFSFTIAVNCEADDAPHPSVHPEVSQPTTASRLPALAGFDLATLADIMEDEAAIIHLLWVFRQDAAATMAQMETHLASEDIAAAERSLHRLKGSAGNVGALLLHHTAEVLDAEMKRGAYQENSLQAFRSAYQAAMESLKALPAMNAGVSADHPARPEDFQNLSAELASLLADKFLVPNELMLQLEAATPPERLADYRQVKRHVDNIQYGKALEALQHLLENKAP